VEVHLDRKLVDLVAARLRERYGDRAAEFVRDQLEHAGEQTDALSAQAWQDVATALERGLTTTASPQPDASDQPVAAGLTVLVVDDEPDVRDTLVRMLKPKRYNVVLADSGAAALRVLDGIAPDLVLSDVVMPGMTGFDLAYRARQRRPELKFLFITGFAERVSGMDDRSELDKVLTKPIMPSDLRHEVAALIG
jgi:CheY-like chemotaxis protein